MNKTPLHRIHALRQMTVGELRQEWERLHGEPTQSRNKDHLFRRLAWRIQELANGGLSGDARARIDELAPTRLQRTRTSQGATPGGTASPQPKPIKIRDINMPIAGTVLTRIYKGTEIRVVTLDDGFEYDGRVYGSLTAVAKAVTGQHWNGKLFFGLTKRKR